MIGSLGPDPFDVPDNIGARVVLALFLGGGDEAGPLSGRLGAAEPIAKPTAGSVFVLEVGGGK